MSSGDLEETVMRVAAIADKLPEKYQQKGFELLLQAFLGGVEPVQPGRPETGSGEAKEPSKLKIPLKVKAILSQYEVPEERIGDLFESEGKEIVPKFILKNKTKAQAQIQLALMVALENALKEGGKFEFDIETVRKRCQEHDVYDTANYLSTFSKAKNLKLFKSLDNPKNIELTEAGKAELAKTVAQLGK